VADPLEDFRLWLPGYGATDTRARFNYVSEGGNSINLLLRDIQLSIIRDGTGDWQATYTEPTQPELTWTARSDSSSGAVLTLIARRCGLGGEIRGDRPSEEAAAPYQEEA
jgi:hypothetical protein